MRPCRTQPLNFFSLSPAFCHLAVWALCAAIRPHVRQRATSAASSASRSVTSGSPPAHRPASRPALPAAAPARPGQTTRSRPAGIARVPEVCHPAPSSRAPPGGSHRSRSRRQGRQRQRHGLGADGRQQAPPALASGRPHEGVDVQPLVATPDIGGRALAARGPHPADDGQAEAVFVLGPTERGASGWAVLTVSTARWSPPF